MNDETFKYYHVRSDAHPCPMQGRYEYSPSKGFAWLQRLAIWVLDRLGCQAFSLEKTYSQVTVNMENFRDLIYSQRTALYKSNGPEGIKGIIMGPEEFSKLTNSDMTGYPHMLQIPPLDKRSGCGAEFAGMKVYVLPWAKGVTLLPDL